MEGAHSGGGGQIFLKSFLMKIVVFTNDAGIVSLSPLDTIWFRRPRRVAPAADQLLTIQKNTMPAVPRRGFEAEVHHGADDFHGSGANCIIHV